MSLTGYTDPQKSRVYVEDFPDRFPSEWSGTDQWYADFKNVLSRELNSLSDLISEEVTIESDDELLTALGLTTEDHEWRIANLEEILEILGGAVGVDINTVGLTVTGNVITGTQAVAISGGPASKAYFGIQADRFRVMDSTGGVTKTPFEVFGATIRFRSPIIIETGSSGYSNISDKPTTVAEISPSEAAEIAANTLKITNATHTGAVTGEYALTITDAAVTLAKMADMATASFIGRNTAAVGVPEILSATTARSILNVEDGANNYSHPSHTGDVTGSGALTIANDAVTYGKIQNIVSDQRILGNVAGADEPVVELSASSVRSMLNVASGATAGADWSTNLSNIPDYLSTPSGNSVGITATRVGWYNGTVWGTYITDTGNLIVDGSLFFGSLTDTNLYRSAANLLKTDDSFWTASTLWIGSTKDTSLYRDASNALKTDDTFEALRIGVGIDPHASYSLHSYKLNNTAIQAERGATVTSGILTTMIIKGTTTANMIDTFEPAILFRAEDSSTVENNLAMIGAGRFGADNTGKVRIIPYSAGSLSTVAEFWPANTKLTGALQTTGLATLAGIQLAATSIYRQYNTGQMNLYGGTSGNGANIELYGGSHATQANKAYYDATQHIFRSQAGSWYADFGSYGLNLLSGKAYYINNTKVVSAQGAAISDPASTTAGNNAAIDSILARLRAHGLIAT